MQPHRRNSGGVLIPQTEIHVGVVYRHNIWPTWQVTPMRIAGEVVVCEGNDGKHLDLMGERILNGEFVPVRPLPTSVAYASFDYYETITSLLVFKNGCGIFWHGSLAGREVISTYELKDLPMDVLEANPNIFGPFRFYTYKNQILDVAQELFGDKWQPVPHNYSLFEITATIDSGVLKPFPVPIIKPSVKPDKEPTIKKTAPLQLSLF